MVENVLWLFALQGYTAECSFSLTAFYYAYQYHLGLIRNIGVYFKDHVMMWLLTRYPQDGHAKKDSSKVWFIAAV